MRLQRSRYVICFAALLLLILSLLLPGILPASPIAAAVSHGSDAAASIRSSDTGPVTTAPGFVKYTLQISSNTLYRGFVPTGGKNLANPYMIAYDPSNGYIYVIDSNSRNVSVIDPSNNSVISSIQTGDDPCGIAYDPSNGYMYVVDHGSDSVSAIESSSEEVIMNITVAGEPQWIAFDPNTGNMYVTSSSGGTYSFNGNGNLTEINSSTNLVTDVIKISGNPGGIAYDYANSRMYIPIASSSINRIDVFNTSDNSLSDTVRMDSPNDRTGIPGTIAYDPANGEMYCMDTFYGQVIVINSTSNLASFGTSAVAEQITYNPENGYMYLAEHGFTVLNGSTDSEVTQFFLTSGVTSSAYDPVNGFLYATNYDNGSVEIIQAVGPNNVTFREHGMSRGSAWSVTLNGLTVQSRSDVIMFNEPDGTYNYSVNEPDNYYLFSPTSGSVTVSGNSPSYSLNFVQANLFGEIMVTMIAVPIVIVSVLLLYRSRKR